MWIVQDNPPPFSKTNKQIPIFSIDTSLTIYIDIFLDIRLLLIEQNLSPFYIFSSFVALTQILVRTNYLR